MLKLHRQGTSNSSTWCEGDRIPPGTVWLDLVDPTQAEREAVEALLGASLPQRSQIGGLGFSSGTEDDCRVLALHMHLYSDTPQGKVDPVALMVTKSLLVTQRYQSVRALNEICRHLEKCGGAVEGSALLVCFLNAIVDDAARQMQEDASAVVELSNDVFDDSREKTWELRRKLVRVGKLEARLARYRSSMLGVRRVVEFVHERAPDWLGDGAVRSMKVLGNDLKVLDQFDEQLTGKLQFLQDAVLGFINTDQNAVMKLLTVASVVTIPPVILAGVWGMNFKHMPELDKIWGYPMALSALAVSMLLPLIWFGLRGWLSRD